MILKLKAILGSVRFWLLTVAMAGKLSELTLGGLLTVDTVFPVLQVWVLAIVALGTLDSVATKFKG